MVIMVKTCFDYDHGGKEPGAIGNRLYEVYVYGVALILTFIFEENDFSVKEIKLKITNAMIITTSAMGEYEIIVDPRAEESK